MADSIWQFSEDFQMSAFAAVPHKFGVITIMSNQRAAIPANLAVAKYPINFFLETSIYLFTFTWTPTVNDFLKIDITSSTPYLHYEFNPKNHWTYCDIFVDFDCVIY